MSERKKPGRPSKKNNITNSNEQLEQISMSKNTTPETITINDISAKMKQIFGRMQMNQIPYDNFKAAIGRDPLNFIGLLNNPFAQNQRIKDINGAPRMASKTELHDALQSPGSQESVLRDTSAALFYSNYVYQNLIKLNRDVPQFFYYVVPEQYEDTNPKLTDELHFVENFVNKFNPSLTFKTTTLQVSREGKCSYVFRSSYNVSKDVVDFALLQKLPQKYVKYTGFGSESPLIVSFDFSYFVNPQNSITQWPSWFQDIWAQLLEQGYVNIDKNGAYRIKPMISNKSVSTDLPDHMFECINGTYYLYVELPQDLVYTFGADLGDPYAIPEFSGLFEDLSELDAYKTLQQQTLLTNITNILTAEVPVEKDAKGGSDAAILSPEVILGLENDCSTVLSDNIVPFFAPLENFKMHAMDHIPNAMDVVLNSVRNVMSTAGVSGLINTNDKPSVAMIKGEQMLIESKVQYYTLQYEKFLNLMISKLGLSHHFKVILWGGVYTWREEVKVLKEMVQNGNKGLLPRLLSAYRTTMSEYAAEYAYVDSFGCVSDHATTKTTSVVGRPPTEDSDVDNDNTAASKEQGGNVSEVKS